MKSLPCISLWQPWASALAIRSKRNETRSWATSYRGPIAIHAAKRAPVGEMLHLSCCWNWCTEQRWWHRHVEPYRDRTGSPLRVEFLPDRRRFIQPGKDGVGPNERPPFGVCLLIWGLPR